MENDFPDPAFLGEHNEKLERQVAQAQAELEQYQRLLNELPCIYEEKFRQKVRGVAQEIARLLDERKALQEQVSRALEKSQSPKAFLPLGPNSPTTAQTAASRLQDVRFLHFKVPFDISPFFLLRRLSLPAFQSSNPRDRLVSIALGAGLFLTLLALCLPQLVNRDSAMTLAAPTLRRGVVRSQLPVSTNLRLEARGGQSWVLVERLAGGTVYDAILEPGQIKDLSLDQGLRIRSGRPDLLYMSVGSVMPEVFGTVEDLDWVEVRP